MAERNEKVSELKREEEAFLECEKRWVFGLLMLVGGYFGGFTYTIRGGIFCNAQTANVVLFAIELGRANWSGALYYVIPISAYMLGALLSESAGYYIKRLHLIRWDTMFIIVEMAAVVMLALLPESAPYQITQVAVNFICSMQFNTFRQAQGIPMATTFCTNHIRQVGIAASKLLRHHGGKAYAERMFFHLKMLGLFAVGVICAVLLCARFQGRAMFFALLPLAVVLADLLYADLKTERGSFDKKPHGH